MKTFADRIIAFNESLDFTGELPSGISLMNPFRENSEILTVSSAFYRKYYNDFNQRHLILGINPGRFGAGVTGIPFTDTRHLTDECGISYNGRPTHETSSVFVYEVIGAYGGPEKFYGDFYISAVCPLGFTIRDAKGSEKNYNYYDNKELTDAVYSFMVESIREQISFGVNMDVCFCLGTGKNEKFLQSLNDRYGFFGKIIALEHPRFVMQYKARSKQQFIDKYLNAFTMVKKSDILFSGIQNGALPIR